MLYILGWYMQIAVEVTLDILGHIYSYPALPLQREKKHLIFLVMFNCSFGEVLRIRFLQLYFTCH